MPIKWEHNGQSICVLQKTKASKDSVKEDIYYELVQSHNFLAVPLGDLMTKDQLRLCIDSGVSVSIHRPPTVLAFQCPSENENESTD